MPEQYPRVAIVTGATSGIGEAIARKFVASGYGVVGNGRNAAKLRTLEQELGVPFVGLAGDVADGAVLDRLFVSAQQRLGKVADIVVANAGRGLGGSVTDADLSKFEDMLKINVTGTLALLQKAARKMLDGRQPAFPGSAADIVVIGSVVGRHISPFSAVYGASKFAVHALAEGLRREVGPKGVRVSWLSRGSWSAGSRMPRATRKTWCNILKTDSAPCCKGGTWPMRFTTS